MLDEDMVNELVAEDKAYRKWEREEKNRILRMHNPDNKRKAWDKLFPKPDYSGLTEEELTQPY